jgi:hypothetical protein
MAIWYILWPFDVFLPVLVSCVKKILATLIFFFGLRKKFIALDSGSILPRQAFTPSRALSRNLTTA